MSATEVASGTQASVQGASSIAASSPSATAGHKLVCSVAWLDVSSATAVILSVPSGWTADLNPTSMASPSNGRGGVAWFSKIAAGGIETCTVNSPGTSGGFYAEAKVTEWNGLGSHDTNDASGIITNNTGGTFSGTTVPNTGTLAASSSTVFTALSLFCSTGQANELIANSAFTQDYVQQNSSATVGAYGGHEFVTSSAAVGSVFTWVTNDPSVLGFQAAICVYSDSAAVGAALAGNATAAAAVAGAISTAIRAAAGATSATSATANLMRLMAAALAATSGTGALTAGVHLAVNAIAATIGSATLTGSLALAAAASVNSSAMAALTNYSTVTLTAPLYTGQGGLLDSNNWLDSKPQVGSIMYYDGTHLVIAPDGELSSPDSNNFTAVVMFDDPSGNWAFDSITFTPNMVEYANTLSSINGLLSTGIILLGAAQTLSSAVSNMNTQIKLLGPMSQLSSAAAQLGSQILLLASLTDASNAAGTLTGTNQSMQGAAVSSTTATAFLNAQIEFLAAAVAVVSATGNLVAQVRMQASALSVSGALGTIQTNISLQTQAQAATAATAALLTAIRVAGPAINLIVASGVLTAQIALVGAALDGSSASGDLQANTAIAGAAHAISSAQAALSALVQLNVSVFSPTQVQGALLAQINASAQAESDSSVTGSLTATGSPVGLYTADPFFVIGHRRQFYTEVFPEVSPFDSGVLTFDFKDDLIPTAELQGLIEVHVIASAGTDPGLPANLLNGVAAYDASLTEVLQPFHDGLQDCDYYFTVTAPTNMQHNLTRFGILSVRG